MQVQLAYLDAVEGYERDGFGIIAHFIVAQEQKLRAPPGVSPCTFRTSKASKLRAVARRLA